MNFWRRPGIAPLIDNGSKLSWGFVIAIACVVLIGLFMFNTRWGYTIRMIGINQAFAKYSGMKVATVIVLSQVLGGFLAGIGGGIEMLGRYPTFSWSSLPGYGWTASPLRSSRATIRGSYRSRRSSWRISQRAAS